MPRTTGKCTYVEDAENPLGVPKGYWRQFGKLS
jgi:hypothetical protein